MTPLRRLAAVTAAAALVGAGAHAAHAEGFVTVPTDPVTAHRVVTLTGDVDAAERDRLELRLTAPGAGPQVVAQLGPAATTDRARSLSADLDTGACSLAAVCGRGTAPNGSYAVQLVALRAAELGGGERLLAEAPVVLDVPARAPSGVAARVTAPRRVTVSWARGTEPDLREWQVSDGAGRTETVTPGQACAEGTCTASFSYADADSGARTYAVAARRACASRGCEAPLSAAATTGPVDVSAAGQATSSATPSPDGSAAPGSPSPGTGPGGGGTGGTGTADTRSLGLGLGGFGPAPEVPDVPGLAQPPTVAAPEVADAFEGTLGYEDRVEVAPLDEPAVEASGREPAVATTTGALVDEQLVSSVAGALVLLLAGAHLRAWLARGRREVPLGD